MSIGLELRILLITRCCTMVGLVENALEEIKEKMNPDRIIIESRYAHFRFRPSSHADIIVDPPSRRHWRCVYES